MINFTHLHVHTQYSILDGLSSISALFDKAKADKMTALAITDHGTMSGVKEFHNKAKENKLKPILGCEAYVATRNRKNTDTKEDRIRYHLTLLAKNKTGYHNLIKLISLAWIEGYYYKPRIDWELLEAYHQGLIASTACLAGEIPRAILNGRLEEAENIIIKYKNLFENDFYLELMRLKTNVPGADTDVFKDQCIINQHLISFSKKYNIKLIATNDVHFINAEDAETHDRLICLKTNALITDSDRIRYTKQEWFKTQAEMLEIFEDIPEALENTAEIVEKVEFYELDRAPVMPVFPIPENFGTEENYRSEYDEEKLKSEFDNNNYSRLGGYDKVLRIKLEADYLYHLVSEGAESRYGLPIKEDLKERIEFELDTIKKMGFPGYFLIVWDFLNTARKLSVAVGPGRGSAAGSVVAYCLKITDIDPLKYGLLFERFLNPDRISMPDIDIDFDNEGREKVLNYVENKYGHNHVANIITFGTMAARSAIRDVARVQNLSQEADRIAKLVPERPDITLKQAMEEVPELKELKNSARDDIISVLQYAEALEGCIRHTSVHACGIIISKEPLIEYLPVAVSKESHLLVTQFEDDHVEPVGMLKMDFLGLKTLSIIKDTLDNIKLSNGIDLDINSIPFDDKKTYELYSKGETTGLFQFESEGMKKYLKELKPTKLEDLIAMNALYRPGPMEYIPDFINRKHGKTKIVYELPVMKEVLEETYGITVYQEQVMQLSRIMANFTGGEADTLRWAMSKKKQYLMNQLKPKFIEGSKKLYNLDEEKAQKIWNDWIAFSKYAFNKSHATAYSFLSYQTGYLKAHFPEEFMAAVLSHHLNDIKKISFFMDECRRMGIPVLGPDINESHARFTVNKRKQIRFGLNAIKGIGENAVCNITEERDINGSYSSIFNFLERVNLQTVNKKSIEALAASGALDCFELKRHQYFSINGNDASFIEILIKYGNNVQKEKGLKQQTLFDTSATIPVIKPKISGSQEWSYIEQLNKEKELIGIYLSAHPLDIYDIELKFLKPSLISQFHEIKECKGKEITLCGIITNVKKKKKKNGKPYASVTIEDYSGFLQFQLFGKDFLDFNKYFVKNYAIYVKGKIQPKQYGNNPEELEFKIKHIDLLANLKDTLIHSIQIKIPVNFITDKIINEIHNLVENNKGKILLKIFIIDTTKNINLEMYSRTYRINLSEEIVKYLKQNQDIEYKIN
ncbi:MAG: DNA polymerase III subunit alpha [Bacteroidia bacterium]|nr:DNA polymerase III subunit alpha [Bacteroidia bacterium]